jgi:integrase
MTLADFLSAIYLPAHFGVSALYAADLTRCVRRLDEWAGEPINCRELAPGLLAAFLAYRLTQADSPVTVNNRRRQLLTLWSAAADDSLAPPPLPRRVSRLPEPIDPPEAWTVDEVSELLWTAQHWPGKVADVPAGVWWDSLFSAAYWTGVRISALRSATKADYDGRQLRIRGRIQKNKRGQLFEVPPHLASKLDRIVEYPSPLLWPWPHCRRHLFTVARRIIERAGLPCPHEGRMLFHRLRRTHVSYAWRIDPAVAQRSAGHSSPETTRRHYVSPAIAPERSAADCLPVPAFWRLSTGAASPHGVSLFTQGGLYETALD